MGGAEKTKLTDPSAGVYQYTYNDFGETLTETTPKGVTTYTLDATGKVTQKDIGYWWRYNKCYNNLLL